MDEFLETEQSGKLLANAFLAPDRRALVVHVLNGEQQRVDLRLRLKPDFGAPLAKRLRTGASPDESCAELPDLAVKGGVLVDALPAKSLTTYRLERR